MADITAAAVKAFRERTGLPLMDCKRALTDANGDEDAAVELLRKSGQALAEKRGGRETTFGSFGLYTEGGVGAMVELKCESAPVTKNEEFIQLASDLAKQLATGPGASSGDELLSQPSPSVEGKTLGEQRDDLFNRIREVFNVGRMVRIDNSCGGYLHPGSEVHGVLLESDGGEPELLRDICMHVAAMSPAALNVEDLDAEVVAKERDILRAAALNEGKPENIVDKMVEGKLRKYYAERVLVEQAFVKDDKQTVGKYASSNGATIKQFIHWRLGEA